MRILVRPWLWCLVAVSGISTSVMVPAQPRSSPGTIPVKIQGVDVADILQRLGAKLERETSKTTLDDYSNHFDRTDPNRDGKHTRKEYVDNGRYLTPQARSGIFRAADGNGDGVVTRAEYVLNRIITDEAKELVQRMDDDEDGRTERSEFLRHSTKRLASPGLATEVFSVLDSNSDGVINVPEYLRVWGQWARGGRESAEKRIAKRRAELAATPGQEKERRVGSGPPNRRGQSRRPTGGRTASRSRRTGRSSPSGAQGNRFGGGLPGPDQFVERALRFDADKDGKLDRRELLKFAESLEGRPGGRGDSGGRGRTGGRRSSKRP
ncbi:MAG: hypothetical protein QF363_09140 [Planctomycetaceae bacterium]|nr:hypothetical protein [Planctomycetaceae bacterium]